VWDIPTSFNASARTVRAKDSTDRTNREDEGRRREDKMGTGERGPEDERIQRMQESQDADDATIQTMRRFRITRSGAHRDGVEPS
jgi:hypothetical protein